MAASADTPPLPDHLLVYGHALVGGANVAPAVQPVIAFVGSTVCGAGSTLLVAAGDGVPPNDAGRTVYTVTVLAAGTGPAQRPACGLPGSNVVLYLPVSGLVASQAVIFDPGETRVDLGLDIALANRRTVPLLANDGIP